MNITPAADHALRFVRSISRVSQAVLPASQPVAAAEAAIASSRTSGVDLADAIARHVPSSQVDTMRSVLVELADKFRSLAEAMPMPKVDTDGCASDMIIEDYVRISQRITRATEDLQRGLRESNEFTRRTGFNPNHVVSAGTRRLRRDGMLNLSAALKHAADATPVD